MGASRTTLAFPAVDSKTIGPTGAKCQNGQKTGGEAAGRRLDFLMQELNREANTLASKSQDLDTTRLTVDMKVLIEQMREQVQNVE